MRLALLALTVLVGACADADPPGPTLDGIDPATDADLAPEGTLQPEAGFAPETGLAPEASVQPDSAALAPSGAPE